MNMNVAQNAVTAFAAAFEDYQLQIVAIGEINKRKKVMKKKLKARTTQKPGAIERARNSFHEAMHTIRRKSSKFFQAAANTIRKTGRKMFTRKRRKKPKDELSQLYKEEEKKNKERLRTLHKKGTLGKNKTIPSKSRKLLLKKKSKTEPEDFITQAKRIFEEFLLSLLKVSCKYAALESARNCVSNSLLDEEQKRRMLLEVLKLCCGKTSIEHKQSKEFLSGIVELLLKNTKGDNEDLRIICDSVLLEGTSAFLPNVSNLTLIITRLCQKNKVLGLDELKKYAKRSCTMNPDWGLWPAVVQLVFENMSKRDQRNLAEVRETAMKKNWKLPAPVSKRLAVLSGNASKRWSRRGSGVRDLMSFARKSLGSLRGKSAQSLKFI